MEYSYFYDEEDRLEKGGLTESDKQFLEEYRRSLPKEDPSEILTMHLRDVIEVAIMRKKRGIALSDLIAEGNLGLAETLAAGVTDPEEIFEGIGAQIDLFYETQQRVGETDRKLAAQVELLSETIDRWISDYGEKPTVDELANALDVTQERIIDILRLSGDEPKDER